VSVDTAAYQDMYRLSGSTAVPQININGEMVIGFNEPLLRAKLGITSVTSTPTTTNTQTISMASYNFMTYLGMNINNLPLSNPKIRLAVSLSIDRNAIANSSNGDKIVSIVSSSANPYIKDKNLDAARSAMRDAGYPNGFSTNIVTSNELSNVAQLIQADLVNIGIKCDIRVMEASILPQLLSQNKADQLFLTSEAITTGDKSELLGRLFSTRGPRNFTNYSNNEFDIAFKSGLYQQAENIAFDENNKGLAVVPLFWQPSLAFKPTTTTAKPVTSAISTITTTKPTTTIITGFGTIIPATLLYTDYVSNQYLADTQYKNKIINVSGTVKVIGKYSTDKYYASLQVGASSYYSVYCVFDTTYAMSQLSIGKTVVIQGLCTGLSYSEVYLFNCIDMTNAASIQ
jgi:hypothetical protein